VTVRSDATRCDATRCDATRARLFRGGFQEDAPSVRIVKRLTFVALAIHLSLATYSGYRAIVQVRGVTLEASDRVLDEGTVARAAVVSSGRVEVTLRLELVQGARAETLATVDVPRSREAAYDPRTKRGHLSARVTPALLARFAPGRAILRATAIGSPQWLRTPPPTVREIAVEIGRPGDAER
jgi:hypothetical protein